MADEDETTLNMTGLDKLIRLMGVKPPTAKVGILGTKVARDAKAGTEGGLNNAEVGSFHEFGSGNNPQRSFLRVPIAELLEKRMESSGALDKDVLAEAVASGSLTPYMKKIAVLAEDIVLGAFDSGGYGKWQPSNMAHKTNAQTLVETQQLRNSVTSEVKE